MKHILLECVKWVARMYSVRRFHSTNTSSILKTGCSYPQFPWDSETNLHPPCPKQQHITPLSGLTKVVIALHTHFDAFVMLDCELKEC